MIVGDKKRETIQNEKWAELLTSIVDSLSNIFCTERYHVSGSTNFDGSI